jgi:hypothetical protein
VTRKQPVLMQAGGGDTAIEYSALDVRAIFDALILTEGVIGLSSLDVTQRAAGANFSVDVAAGFCAITGDDVALQGKYLCQATAVENLVIPSPPVSGSHIHRVIARIKDKLHNGSWSTYEWTLEVLPDVGSGTPALPASAITLALVTVASGASNVVDGNISDQRPSALMWPTRPHAVGSDAGRPQNPQVFETVGRTDRAPLREVWDGSSWRMDSSAAAIYKDRGSDATGRTSTTLADDDILTVTLLANVTYELSGIWFYTADADGDLKWKLIPPNNGTINGSSLGLPAASTGSSGPITVDQFTEGSTLIGGGSGATIMTITVQAKIWSGDGGTFKLQWSRDGATGTTVLKQHSYMRLVPVGI